MNIGNYNIKNDLRIGEKVGIKNEGIIGEIEGFSIFINEIKIHLIYYVVEKTFYKNSTNIKDISEKEIKNRRNVDLKDIIKINKDFNNEKMSLKKTIDGFSHIELEKGYYFIHHYGVVNRKVEFINVDKNGFFLPEYINDFPMIFENFDDAAAKYKELYETNK